MGITSDIVVIIVAALVSALLAQKLKQPLIIGYIFAGIIIGPNALGIITSDIQVIELLAEIGVALLLFSIGLDFSLNDLKPVKAFAMIGIPIQILLTAAYGYGIGKWLGWETIPSLWLGAMISMSSTMVIMKSLMNQGWMGTLSSRVMVGSSVIQDLAVVPMMIILPKISDPASGLPVIGLAIVKSIIFLVLMMLVGTRLLPRLLSHIASWNSRELFVLSITAIGLGIGYITYLNGLSFAFGAFVAGVVLSESDYGRQALTEIIPLRDVFALLFFTSVGMLLDPVFLYANWPMILLLVVLVSIGKGIIFAVLAMIFRYGNVIPLAMGLGLFQIGEISFVLARIGLETQSIGYDTYSLVLTTTVITLILTPFISNLTAPLYSLRKRLFKKELLQTINLPESGLNNHVVIAGGGKVGQHIAKVLKTLNLPFVMIELNFNRVNECKAEQYPIIYGDAGQEIVLEAAQIQTARLLLITTPSVVVSQSAVRQARIIAPELQIVARANGSDQMEALYAAGVSTVILPELEAGLEIARQALLHLNLPVSCIQNYTDTIRHELYSPIIHNNSSVDIISQLKSAKDLLELTWVSLPADSPLNGKSIRELNIRRQTGASIVGIISQGDFLPNPDVDHRFSEGEMAAVIGSAEARTAFQQMASPKTALIQPRLRTVEA